MSLLRLRRRERQMARTSRIRCLLRCSQGDERSGRVRLVSQRGLLLLVVHGPHLALTQHVFGIFGTRLLMTVFKARIAGQTDSSTL